MPNPIIELPLGARGIVTRARREGAADKSG